MFPAYIEVTKIIFFISATLITYSPESCQHCDQWKTDHHSNHPTIHFVIISHDKLHLIKNVWKGLRPPRPIWADRSVPISLGAAMILSTSQQQYTLWWYYMGRRVFPFIKIFRSNTNGYSTRHCQARFSWDYFQDFGFNSSIKKYFC